MSWPQSAGGAPSPTPAAPAALRRVGGQQPGLLVVVEAGAQDRRLLAVGRSQHQALARLSCLQDMIEPHARKPLREIGNDLRMERLDMSEPVAAFDVGISP